MSMERSVDRVCWIVQPAAGLVLIAGIALVGLGGWVIRRARW